MYNRNTPKKMVVDRLFTFEKGPILLGDGKCLVCRDVDDTLKLGKLGAIPETEQKSDISTTLRRQVHVRGSRYHCVFNPIKMICMHWYVLYVLCTGGVVSLIYYDPWFWMLDMERFERSLDILETTAIIRFLAPCFRQASRRIYIYLFIHLYPNSNLWGTFISWKQADTNTNPRHPITCTPTKHQPKNFVILSVVSSD